MGWGRAWCGVPTVVPVFGKLIFFLFFLWRRNILPFKFSGHPSSGQPVKSRAFLIRAKVKMSASDRAESAAIQLKASVDTKLKAVMAKAREVEAVKAKVETEFDTAYDRKMEGISHVWHDVGGVGVDIRESKVWANFKTTHGDIKGNLRRTRFRDEQGDEEPSPFEKLQLAVTENSASWADCLSPQIARCRGWRILPPWCPRAQLPECASSGS